MEFEKTPYIVGMESINIIKCRESPTKEKVNLVRVSRSDLSSKTM